MKGYEQYIQDVKTGKIKTGRTIKQAVERFIEFRNRPDIYFDEKKVDECIRFISNIKHFLGKSAGKPFILQPWQELLVATIFGLKWKATGFRVCTQTYIQIARKAGKDALVAAILLYILICDGEAAPEIIASANCAKQAGILFDYISNFAKGLDPDGRIFKYYRQSVKLPKTKGIVDVISADPSKADGKNILAFCVDEFEEAPNRKMFDVLASSQGMREQPLGIIICTAGFDLDGPCHDMYELSIQVLAKVKTMDNFFPFIYEMDEDDDWQDESNWIKCQPNLGVTVTKDWMRGEMNKALADSTAFTGVVTKTFNKWVASKITWIPQNIIANLMRPIDIMDYEGKTCIMGCDFSSVGDFSSISVMIPPDADDGKYVFKTWTFLPENVIATHPNRLLYEKFIQEGTMIRTQGNVIDQDYIIAKIGEISRVLNISAIYLDRYNARAIQVALTDAGYNVYEYSQSIGNYNIPTKDFEVKAKSGQMVIDKSANILWQFGNVFLKQDFNGNVKPSKESASKKIDSVISMTTALGGFLKDPVTNDIDIVFF